MKHVQCASLVGAIISISIPVGVGVGLRPASPFGKRHDPSSSHAFTAQLQANNPKMPPSPKISLHQLMTGIGNLEKQGRSPLSKGQANEIQLLLANWKHRPSMSHEEAEVLCRQLKEILTAQQQSEMKKLTKRPALVSAGKTVDYKQSVAKFAALMPSDPAEVEALVNEIQQTNNFLATVNPLYPPSFYRQIRQVSPVRQQKMQESYQTCQWALSQVARNVPRHSNL